MPVITPFIPPATPPIIRHLSTSQYGQKPLVINSHGYHYVLTGNTLLPDSRIRNILASALTAKAAVSALNKAYHQNGYFLVAIKATVEGTTIRIQIIQGQLTQTDIANDVTWFFPDIKYRPDLRENTIVYQSVLANAFAQRNGQRLQIGFGPSSNPGGSRMNVSENPIPGYQPITGNIFFGNYGSRYSGRYLTGGSVSYNPGLGLNISLNGTQGLPSLTNASKGSQYSQGGINASSITPWGIYSFNAQWVHYRLGDVAFPVNPTGNIFTWGISGSQLVYANDRSRWALNEGYNHVANDVKVYQSVIPGGYPLTIQHYNYFDVGTQWSLSYNLLHKPGSLNTSFTYNQGVSGSRGTLYNHTPGYPAAQFHYFVASISTSQALPLGMSASFSASGQGAFNTLPQQNQWVLGGFGSLSAYYPGVLVGDSGYSARFQLQSPNWAFQGFSASANLFAETGGTTFTYLARNQAPWQSLSDVGIGLHMQSPWGTNISVMSALPVGWNQVSASVRKASRVDAYFVLSQNF